MFHQPAWAVGICSSGPLAARTVGTKSTGGCCRAAVTLYAVSDSRVEGLEVLKVLPERLEEEPELPELEEVGPVLVVAGGLVLGEVEGAVDGRLAVEQLVALQHVAHALVSLERCTKYVDTTCYNLLSDKMPSTGRSIC